MRPDAHSRIAFAFTLATTVVVAARTQTPSVVPPTAVAVTVEGCLYKEVDVPGRHVPDQMRSRTVTDEDFVLSGTKMIKGTEPPSTATSPPDKPVGASTTATASNSTMYKVKGASLKLGEHAGHRVQVDGTFDHQERAGKPSSFAFDLVTLNGTALRPVSGECPKK